jgi:uncharacterized protein (TIGR02246 family)
MTTSTLQELGTRYASAWCSQDPHKVAAFYAENGSLTINGGAASVGRTAIVSDAQSFMTAFPDMVVAMDGIGVEGDHVVFRWTLTGTNTGPGGSGKSVRISGHEQWTLGADGLVAKSNGHFDEAEYARQIQFGVDGR